MGDLAAALPPRLGVFDEFVEARSDSGAPLPARAADQAATTSRRRRRCGGPQASPARPRCPLPATLSASGTVRTLWSRRMLASHNGYHKPRRPRLTTFAGMLSCSSIRSRSEYGSNSPRPSPPVATMAKPLVSVIPISAAFVVSQNSCRSSSASRSAAESSWREPPASSCSARCGQIGCAAVDEPAAGSAPDREAPAAESGFCSVISSPPPALYVLTLTRCTAGRRRLSSRSRIKGRRSPARRCGPGPRCRPG